jgi:Zn-dependent M16 (insulinase) family peptidase
MKTTLLSSCLIFIFCVCNFQYSSAQNPSLNSLSYGDTLNGFKATAVYLNDADKPMGARFVHIKTGFTLDLLQIESVPQAFIWVNTLPVSDRGEPHTQEHLLITKGNKGRALNTREGMSLAQSNAFTDQLITAYDFNTNAGSNVFYVLFEKFLDALLYPDYTDEEVKREVRNWGVSQNPDKTLSIQEKGTVYNEMSTSMNHPDALIYDTIGRMLYGNASPLSYNAGGLPSGIRELNEAEILKFHSANYYLGNMGAITSLSKNMKLNDVLDSMNNILNMLERSAGNASHAPATLPPPQPVEAGKIVTSNYPSENAAEPGSMLLAFPASLDLTATEDVMLGNFLSVFAGDASTNLYKLFINSNTKIPGIDGQYVYGYNDNKQGEPVFFGLGGISAENLTADKAALVRQTIIDELKKVAAFKDHSPELKEFNDRFENSLISTSRYYSKFVNTPPKFGFRNTGDSWYNQLLELNKIKGFKKSVVLKPQINEIEKMLSGGTNIWKNYLDKWNLTTALPYVVISKAEPSLIKEADSARLLRASNEVARLKNLYHTNDDQQTIIHYKSLYDSATAVLEKLQDQQSVKFIAHPPLTLDDDLDYRQLKLSSGVPLTASVFNNISGSTTGIALDLHTLPAKDLVYLAILPDLITQTGIIKNGKAISYEDMSQLLQKQILSLSSYYSIDETTARAELVIKGAGNNDSESLKSIEWMNDVLQQPDWTMKNLARIQDLVQQDLSSIRTTMQNAEEGWVNEPSVAYRCQDKPLLLSTASFLTREHNIFLLKWMLKKPKNIADSNSIQNFFSLLNNINVNRDQLKQLFSNLDADSTENKGNNIENKKCEEAFKNLSPSARLIVKDGIDDLEQTTENIPDTSLAMDFKYLCRSIQHGIQQTPEKTLAELNTLRKSLLNKNNARFFTISSESTQQKIVPALNKMLSSFSNNSLQLQKYSSEKIITARVQQRMHTTETPVFVGLINPNSITGVFINTAPLAGYRDSDTTKLLQFLCGELYGGAGKQSVYTKTISAGLSYSTGVHVNLLSGNFEYYAERTPVLPQTLKFVINEIKRSPVDTSMLDYVISLAVRSSRAASDYEDRGEAMSNDIVDGFPADVIKKFRLAILKLRDEPGVIYKIYSYKDAVYEKILPGYGIPSAEVSGASYFVIGPEKQMVAYEAYLKSAENKDAKLFRLYPRDFWEIQ